MRKTLDEIIKTNVDSLGRQLYTGYVMNDIKRKAVIVDIDGVLADCRHRLPLIKGDKKDWDTFFKEMSEDTFINPLFLMLSGLSKNYHILYVTGRPEKYRIDTVKWLYAATSTANISAPVYLFMRGDKDFRHAPEVKKETYIERVEPHFDIVLAIDDCPKVCAMWQELGLPVLQASLFNEQTDIRTKS